MYDLSSKIATRRIPKVLLQFNSMRIQKSVFEAIVNEKEEEKLWEKLLKNINMETDKILWIPITEDEERGSIHYGRNCFSLEESENFVCI